MPDDGNIAGLAAAIAGAAVDDFLTERRRSLEKEDWERFAGAAAEAHRRGELDLSTLLSGNHDRRPRFGTQQFVELVVPLADLSLEQLLALTHDAVTRSKDSGTPYWMQSAVAAWSVREPARPSDLLRAIEDCRAPQDLRYTAIVAWLDADRIAGLAAALDGLEHRSQPVSDIIANALGRYGSFNSAERTAVTEALQARLQSARDADVSAPLRALLGISLRHDDVIVAGQEALTEVSSRIDRHVREAIAFELMFQARNASPDLVRPAMGMLVRDPSRRDQRDREHRPDRRGKRRRPVRHSGREPGRSSAGRWIGVAQSARLLLAQAPDAWRERARRDGGPLARSR